MKVHFCHANGFPAKSYSVMLDRIAENFELSFLDMHGHHPNYPISNNWQYLVNELIDEITVLHHEPIVAIGHSMGGVLIFLAAQQRPELFKHLILLDPPLLDTMASIMIGLAKRFKFIDRITPAGRTKGRQEVFEDHQHAFEYFSNKSLFKRADARCLKDYIEHGTARLNQSLKLKYGVENEVAIYRTLPNNISLKNSIVPSTLLYGDSSDVIRPALLRQLKNIPSMDVKAVHGGHLFPLEFPEQTADHIQAIIEAL